MHLTMRREKLFAHADARYERTAVRSLMPVLLVILLLVLVSCGNSYNIQGSSDVAMLDGRMLYLKIYQDNDLKTIDSCDIVHGQFRFNGSIDTVRMATLFMDKSGIMPVVLESGDISVKINNTQRRVSGTPLNEKLFEFLDSYTQLENQYSDLGHKFSQAIMEGEDEADINKRLAAEAAQITQDQDKLVTSFIAENFDNVLGPGVFFMVTAGYRYPELQPWIEDIMSKATDKFKNDAYVKEYYEKAKKNEQILNGTYAPDDTSVPTEDILNHDSPTPGELALPSE